MPLPKEIRFVTFDCYGTLIDWETGAYDAFQKEADRDGFTIDKDALIPLFLEIQREIQSGSYELYAEVLRRTAVRVGPGARLGPGALALRLPARQRARAGRRSARPTPSSSASRRSSRSGSSRTSTTSCSGATRRHFRSRLRPGRHRAAGALATSRTRRTSRSARAGSAARRAGCTSPPATRPTSSPCLKLKVPVIWVNRHGEKLESGQKKPTEEVKTLREAAKLLGVA